MTTQPENVSEHDTDIRESVTREHVHRGHAVEGTNERGHIAFYVPEALSVERTSR